MGPQDEGVLLRAVHEEGRALLSPELQRSSTKWRKGSSQRGSLACDKAGQESPPPLVYISLCPGLGEGVQMDAGVRNLQGQQQGHKGTLRLWCLCCDTGQGWPAWTALVPI